ncbi:hypothetical protein KFU94_56010 [Chloroflexi bacterium TSY]|nr:hypothetical protein [Chloroflexi bacterium TSY]
MLTTTDLRWAQATTPPTLAGQLGPASYSTRPLTPLSLLLLPFFSGQTATRSERTFPLERRSLMRTGPALEITRSRISQR